MRITHILVTLALAGAWLTAGASDVYRWVDEKGVSHYSDKPPADGKFERVNVRAGGASAVSTPDPAAAEQEPAKEDPAIARAERCKSARANLAALRSNLEVSIEDNGKTRALSESERLEYADRNERAIALDCDAP
ncbi:MAG: DUF4124 domain-containing protein [Lysobacteraceae bacterium]